MDYIPTNINHELCKINEDIYRLIANEPCLEFLRDYVGVVRQIVVNEDRISDYKTNLSSKKAFNSNAIYMDNNLVHLSDTGWDYIFSNYQMLYDIVYDIKHNIAESKSKLETKKDYLSDCFAQIITNLREVKTHTGINTLLAALLFDSSAAKYLLIKQLQVLISQGYKMKKTEFVKEFSIPMVTLSIKLATILLDGLIFHHPLLIKIVNIYKTGASKRSVSRAEEILFVRYIEALLNNDVKILEDFYRRFHIKVAFNFNNKFLLKFVSDYMLSLVYKGYENNTTLFISLKTLLDGYRDRKYDDFKYELDKMLVKVGSLIVNQGETILVDKTPPLFTRRTKKESMIKSQTVIIIETSIINNLLFLHSVNKPYLSISNRKYVERRAKDNSLFNMINEHRSRLIHPSITIDMTLQDESYLNKHKSTRFFTIDTRYVLRFLQDHIDVQNGTDEEKSAWCSFLYNVELTSNPPVAEKEIWDLLIELAINLQDNETLVLRIKDQFKNNACSRKYITSYNKIKNNRYILTGLLRDCILYTPFKWFILESFLCSRGREYMNSDYMNVQLFPFAKCIIKPYNRAHVNKTNYKEFKAAVLNQIDNDNLKLKLKKISYADYIKRTTELNKEYIKSYMKEPTSQKSDELVDDKTSITNKSFIYTLGKSIKKKNRTCYVHSILMQNTWPNMYKHISQYFELDSTASGLQMTSILLSSSEIATFCNLTGETNNDIYVYFNQMFFTKIEELHPIVEEFILETKCPEIPDENCDIEIHQRRYYEAIDDVYTVYGDFIFMTLDKSTYDVELTKAFYAHIIQHIDIDAFISKHKSILNLDELTWILRSSESKRIFHATAKLRFAIDKKHLLFLYVMKNLMRLMLCINRFGFLTFRKDEFKNWRTLFKDAIMTYFYNSTSYGRKQKFIDILYEFIPYIDKNNKRDFQDIYTLSRILDKYFLVIIKDKIKDSQLIFDIAHILADTNKPLFYENKFFKIRYYPKKEKSIVIQTPKVNKRRGAQLSITYAQNKFDPRLFTQAFIPNFIHSIDASLMHTVTEKFINLNKELTEIPLHIHFHANHDNFCSNMAPFLKILLEDSYLLLYLEKPINWLLEHVDTITKEKILNVLKNQSLILTKLNPYFVKT